MHNVAGQSREKATVVKHTVLDVSRILREISISSFVLKIIFVVVERSITVIELVIVVAMTHRSRCRKLHAIRDRGTHLSRPLERIVRTVTGENLSTRHTLCPDCFFRNKVDNATDTCTAELGRDSVLVNFNFFDTVEVHGAKVHGSATGIIQRHSVETNQDVSCGNATNAHRLKTSHSALLVALHPGKRRKDFRYRQTAAFPSGRENFSIISTYYSNTCRGRRRNIGNTEILCGSSIIYSHRFRRGNNHRIGIRRLRYSKPNTKGYIAPKNRSSCGFAE